MEQDEESQLQENPSENQPKGRKKNKIPVRKRFKHKKRQVEKLSSLPNTVSAFQSVGADASVSTSTCIEECVGVELETSENISSPCPSLSDHDYASPVTPASCNESRPCSSLSYISSDQCYDKTGRPDSSLSGVDASLSISISEDATMSNIMRWYPTLIRLALSIYLKSPSAYKTLTESGFIKLPTARTLFDYSHASRIEQGIDSFMLETISKQVAKEELKRVQFHVVMADEIHISKNLVTQKSTGEIIGFTNLDNLDKELKVLDSYLDETTKSAEPEVAPKILAYMVRGISSKVKDVVASYPVCNPSAKQMYLWTWEVIGALERSDIKVVAFTCDEAPANRTFIKLNKPVTVMKSQVVFDTINKFAPHKILYFFSDVPHLLKTIRNALNNSRLNNKGVRCLKKNGEPIVWDTILRLYLSKKDMNLRKSYKLTAQTVFLDGYSKMKVSLAAAAISNTVANDILGQQWPKTAEIVEFIKNTNNWFDNLNGAFSYHGKKTNNARLNGYNKSDVEKFEKGVPGSRFQELLDYLQYLDKWTEEIQWKKQQAADMSLLSELGVHPSQEEEIFHALEESFNTGEEENVDSKCLLPHQTLTGIEMSTRAFIGAVTFLIGEGVDNVNARAFYQDPLEQNFGKQRMGGGGSSNPNVAQFLRKQRSISLVGQLAACKRSSGNTEVLDEGNEISIEPLPKRKTGTRKDIKL